MLVKMGGHINLLNKCFIPSMNAHLVLMYSVKFALKSVSDSVVSIFTAILVATGFFR